MAKRGGSAGKEGEIVKDDFFVGETKAAFGAFDFLSRSGFPTLWEIDRDRWQHLFPLFHDKNTILSKAFTSCLARK
ncbi:hypothetical protein TIFTF001_030113 [Ficus carica]|uniref:Uncharacterized protein n=1 Tax=Ficus carica TaxID=3494 RepID=A0AA88DST0_FICCA|nr:hypothetical protein TIFTF001_030113 [Ficus carica]